MSFADIPDASLEAMVDRAHSGDLTDYHRGIPDLIKNERYASFISYLSDLRTQLRKPIVHFVAATIIGVSTMGVYFPGSHEIMINNDPRYASQVSYTLRHEENHALNPLRHLSPRENEIENRLVTQRETGDHGQTQGLEYL